MARENKKHGVEKKPANNNIENDIGIVSEEVPEDFRFEDAHPSLAHMALLGLIENKIIKFLITQNVDNIHYRSGVPR